MASRNPSDSDSDAKAKFFARYGGLRNVPRKDTPGDSDRLERFDPYAGCLFCSATPCVCPPVQFRAWGVVCEFPHDGLKGWIVDPDRCTISINERASREAYQWTSPTAPLSFVEFLQHKFKRENCIVKIKPLF